MSDYTKYTVMTDEALINEISEMVTQASLTKSFILDDTLEDLSVAFNVLMRRGAGNKVFDALFLNCLDATGHRFAVKFVNEVRSGAYKSKSLSASAKRNLKTWMRSLPVTSLDNIKTTDLSYLLRIIHPRPMAHQEASFKRALEANPVENFV